MLLQMRKVLDHAKAAMSKATQDMLANFKASNQPSTPTRAARRRWWPWSRQRKTAVTRISRV